MSHFPNQASEQHAGSVQPWDGMTGAPVTELEYKHALMPYLMRLIWRHINEPGVVPR